MNEIVTPTPKPTNQHGESDQWPKYVHAEQIYVVVVVIVTVGEGV